MIDFLVAAFNPIRHGQFNEPVSSIEQRRTDFLRAAFNFCWETTTALGGRRPLAGAPGISGPEANQLPCFPGCGVKRAATEDVPARHFMSMTSM